MAQIRRDISRFSLTDLIKMLLLIVSKMTGNTKYTALAPKVLAFKAKVDALDQADKVVQANEKEHEQLVLLRNAARTEAETAYASMASATEGESAAPADLVSGGWTLRGAPAGPVGPLPPPTGMSATAGDHDGWIDLTCDANPKASLYKWERAENVSGPWTPIHQGTKSSYTATDLTPGKLYYFHVCVSGAAGDSDWSDPAEKRAP